MEGIHSLNANQLARELQNYDKYLGMTQKNIKMTVGNTAALRVELQKLKEKPNITIKSPIKIINNSTSVLNDNMRDILLNSDLQTIFSVINTNKTMNGIADDAFWNTKMSQYNIPSNKKATELINLSKTRALQMLKITQTYNKYKGILEIAAWNNRQEKIQIYYSKYFKLNKAMRIGIRKLKNKKWQMFIDDDEQTSDITEKEVIEWLIIVLYSYYNNHIVENITDNDTNTLIYENLIKNATKNKPVPRTYLMAYELIM